MSLSLKAQLSRTGAAGRCAVLAAVIILAAAAVLPFAITRSGTAGAWAVLAAAVLVWLSAAVATLAGEGVGRLVDPLWGMVLGMLLRMALPMAACVAVYAGRGPVVAAGFVFFVLGFYLVALGLDTVMAVWKIESPTQPMTD